MTLSPPTAEKPSLELIHPACESGHCQQCPGKGADGYWRFGGDLALMNIALKEAYPGGVRCPCRCHYGEDHN